jgi:hypothetical protein
MRTKREMDECEYGAWVKIRKEKDKWDGLVISRGCPPMSSVSKNRHHFQRRAYMFTDFHMHQCFKCLSK